MGQLLVKTAKVNVQRHGMLFYATRSISNWSWSDLGSITLQLKRQFPNVVFKEVIVIGEHTIGITFLCNSSYLVQLIT